MSEPTTSTNQETAMEINSNDPDFAEKLAKVKDPAIARWIGSVSDLVGHIKRCATLADTADTTADKVLNLELAKYGLGQLEEIIKDDPNVTPEGLETAKSKLAEQERNYRLLGYYKAAGFPDG